ncbi:MAG: recombinase family protein [Oscillospiraceae bacterium]|nr:recombinase family protein [Oscillospiraceae bacterium]
MNVVIYARFSSHGQNEQSIEGQRKICLDFCQQKGYNIIGEYIDRAISGTTDNRPEFQRMIADSAKKHFEYIIVYQLDRFARNRYDSATYKAKLKKNGVRVLSARENINEDASGILMEAVLEGMAEYYSVELGQKIKRGMDLNAEKCLCTGGNVALGYKVADKQFIIDENTAPLVRYIFEMYANGKIITEIITHLNAQGHKTSRGVPFNKNSLRAMLQNKRYIGVYTYRDKEIPDGIPRIIDDDLFYKVAEIMEKNRKAPARAKAKSEYILTTKLFCGYCKEMMTGFSGIGKAGMVYNYYICNGRKKKICKKKMVQKDYIENLVVSECRKLLTDENIKKIANEVVALCEAEKDTTNLKRLNKLLSENKRKHTNLMNAIMECDIESTRKTFYAEIPKIETERIEIENEISKEQSNQVNLTVPQIKFFLSALKKGNVDDIKYRKTLISVFINAIYLYDDKITLVFNSGDMTVTIDDKLLSDIDESNETAKCLFLNNVGPPIGVFLQYFRY